MFRYKIQVTGSEENIVKFAKDLVSLGYEAGSDDHRKMKGIGTFNTNRLTTSNTGLFMYSNKGDFGNIMSSHRPIEYNFDIDKEYDVALAVASQRSDDVPHIGEWLKILGTGFAKNNEHNFPKDALFRVKPLRGDFCYVDKEVKDPIRGESIAYKGQLVKATAEEIIEHFMKQKNQLPEKWCISHEEVRGHKDIQEALKNNKRKTYEDDGGGISFYHGEGYYHNIKTTGISAWNRTIYTGYTEITYEQWKNAQNMVTDKKITGYKLLRDLPHVAAGAVFTWDTEDNVWVHIYKEEGEYVYQYDYSEEEMKNAEWFEPIYESEIKIEEITVRYGADEDELDTDGFTVAVSSDKKITVTDVSGEEGSEIKYEELSKVLDTLKNLKGSKWEISVWYIDIGCKHNVNVTDLIKVREAYERLNSVK